MARVFLSQKYFTDTVAISMKITGSQFIYSGLIAFLALLLGRLFDIDVEPINTIQITPIFIIIIGLFFTIQSKALLLAIKIKNENKLTV